MPEQSLLHKSLRIRYEAFSNFASAVSAADSLERVGKVLAVQAKYVLDVYRIRFYFKYKDTELALEACRGEGEVKAIDSRSPLAQLESQLLQTGVPRYITGLCLDEMTTLKASLFDHEQIQSLYMMPLTVNEDQCLVISVASREHDPYSDPDFRLIKLIAELLSNKLSQLLLLHSIESKNEEMAEVNHELLTLNEEIKRLNLYLEEKVEERTQALIKASEELNTIYYRASHDFRRPLTTILGLANVARHVTSDPDVLQLFSYAEEASQDLIRMLEKLKDLSHYTAAEGSAAPTDFEDIVQRIMKRYEQNIRDKNIIIKVDNRLQVPHLATDGSLYPILENVLENAIFFSYEKPVICIEIEQQAEQLLIQVADNGQGIPEDYHAKVFDMYVRANESSKGNGLGLYVVKKLTERLGGSVSLQSALGIGTTIQLRLPMYLQD